MTCAGTRLIALSMLCIGGLLALPLHASDAIRIGDDVHLGVASCATSVCHGKLTPQEGQNVWLNEYGIWTNQDRHAQAYRTLSSQESRKIAEKLGLPSATTAKICLDCHADNVAEAMRGPKFQITDGVGCEACHGGSARWIESHAEPDVTHADNLARGMYPTEDPLARASICLSCHLGTANQFATHQIMGAGHPRLTFELEAFTVNQPAHYAVDDDYISRKGRLSGFRLWLTGQLESAERYLELVESDLFTPGGMFPELAFYDCHACHHALSDTRWTSAQAGAGIPPGTMRIQDQHLRTLWAVTSVLAKDRAGELRQLTQALVRAGQASVADVRAQSKKLLAFVRKIQDDWSDRTLTDQEARSTRQALLSEAAAGRMADFNDAEQVFLAVESLTLYVGDAKALRVQLDALFLTVEDDRTYDPSAFRSAADRTRTAIR